MKQPAMRGVVDRRILLNYQVDPEVLRKIVPEPYRPRLYKGKGIAGICLVRLCDVRPRFVPRMFGRSSENALHRVAVEWDGATGIERGNWVPRCDTSSRLRAFVGDGAHSVHPHVARFSVCEEAARLSVSFESNDGEVGVRVVASAAGNLAPTSVFETVELAAEFLCEGRAASGGLASDATLESENLLQRMDVLEVEELESTFFEEESVFPRGSIRFDSALLARRLAQVPSSPDRPRGAPTGRVEAVGAPSA